jgi:membrane protein YdbS with pleckstrin-like domain
MRPLPSKQLDKRITRVWRVSALLNTIIWFVIVGAIGLFITIAAASSVRGHHDSGILAVAVGVYILVWLVLVVICLVTFVAIVPKIRYARWRYEVYEEEIDILKGIIWHNRCIIPLIRVQNVDTKQGPVMRWCGLASVTVATAAGSHEIPGLDVQLADKLRDDVARLARLAHEDV